MLVSGVHALERLTSKSQSIPRAREGVIENCDWQIRSTNLEPPILTSSQVAMLWVAMLWVAVHLHCTSETRDSANTDQPPSLSYLPMFLSIDTTVTAVVPLSS